MPITLSRNLQQSWTDKETKISDFIKISAGEQNTIASSESEHNIIQPKKRCHLIEISRDGEENIHIYSDFCLFFMYLGEFIFVFIYLIGFLFILLFLIYIFFLIFFGIEPLFLYQVYFTQHVIL